VKGRAFVVTTSLAALCGCGGTAAATRSETQSTAARPAPVPRQSHGYRLVGNAFAIREPHDNGAISFQARFRINKRPAVDPAGGPKLHVDLAGEGPETAPSRVGLRTRWCYASEIANDYETIPADAKELALSIRVGAIGDHTTIGDQIRVVTPGKAFAKAYAQLGCKA
jgi:hypothetical protein